MSKPKAKRPTTSLERYRSEVKGEPFTLWEKGEPRVVVPRPTGAQMLEAEEVVQTGTSRDAIHALCGDAAVELLEVLGAEDAQVLRAVFMEMQEHFGLGE